jgi:putative FmdB family regulatory protein
MPTSVADCAACARQVEFFQSMTEAPKRKCPHCGRSKLVRQIGAGAGILFRGSGFYLTDYRSDSYKKGEKAEKPSAPCAGDPKSCAASGGPCAQPGSNGSTGETKPAAKKKRSSD